MSNAETWWKEFRVISTTQKAEEYLFTPQLILHLWQCSSSSPHLAPSSSLPEDQQLQLPQCSSWWRPTGHPSGWILLSCSGQSALGFLKLSAPQQWDNMSKWQSSACLVAACLSYQIMWRSRPFPSWSCWLVVLPFPCTETQFTLPPEQGWKIWRMGCHRAGRTVLQQDQLIPWSN